MSKLRRLVHLLVVLVVAAGLAARSAEPADFGAKANMAASSTMPMSGMCDGCGDGNDGCTSAGVCSVTCGSVFVLPAAHAGVGLPIAALGDIPAYLAWIGWTKPPDPYPPRPSIVS
jgi:hypothetical protein